jgi:hypothetical protein
VVHNIAKVVLFLRHTCCAFLPNDNPGHNLFVLLVATALLLHINIPPDFAHLHQRILPSYLCSTTGGLHISSAIPASSHTCSACSDGSWCRNDSIDGGGGGGIL